MKRRPDQFVGQTMRISTVVEGQRTVMQVLEAFLSGQQTEMSNGLQSAQNSQSWDEALHVADLNGAPVAAGLATYIDPHFPSV